jgi:hypothetical protein
MMNRIRVATQKEAEEFSKKYDGRGGTLLALDVPEGTMYAVVRTAVEVDPVVYPENATIRMKAMFQRDIETVLAAQGTPCYFFNVHASNESMLETAKHFGAVQQSTEPELRFVKAL